MAGREPSPNRRLTQDELLRFDAVGNVTLVHVADIHGQLLPVLFREPSVNIGIGEARGLVPHVSGKALLDLYQIAPGSAAAYALTSADFAALAGTYGRLGGLDRIATILNAIRAERADRVVFLDGGDTWQNSYTSLISEGQDMVDCMALLKPDAMVGHWEFTLGAERVKEIVDQLGFPFLTQNMRDTEWNEPVFEPMAMIERGGVRIAVIGQAFPYTPIANPRWMIPNWSFGIREDEIQANVDKARRDGAALVVLLSHNGFDVDRKLASRVKGIDVILTAHTHDALPEVVKVGKTLLVASGSHGEFVSRLDLDVSNGEVKDYRFKLVPVSPTRSRPTRSGGEDRQRTCPARGNAARSHRPDRDSALSPRQFRRHARRPDLDALLAETRRRIALSPGFRRIRRCCPGRDDHARGHL